MKINKKRLACYIGTLAIGIGIGLMVAPAEIATAETPTTTVQTTQTAQQHKQFFENLGEFEITGYCNCRKCCNQYADGKTAIGLTPIEGRTVAVDPTVIPYGTKIWIEGEQYVAEDCGGAIKGNRIDIYHASHNDALAYGRQKHDVYVESEQ